MNVSSWPNNVNQRIISETSITIGEGGYVEDQESNGWKDRRLTSLATPDSFQVVMDFDWGGDDPLFPKDSNGLSEYDRFVRWYKFVHKRGANPFWFPCITKHSVNNITQNQSSDMCLYKITSALQPKESGFSNRITMTWIEVYSGTIDIETDYPSLDYIIPYSDRVEAVFKAAPTNQPLFNQFQYQIKSATGEYANLPLKHIQGYGNTFVLKHSELSPGSYVAKLSYEGKWTNEVTMTVRG